MWMRELGFPSLSYALVSLLFFVIFFGWKIDFFKCVFSCWNLFLWINMTSNDKVSFSLSFAGNFVRFDWHLLWVTTVSGKINRKSVCASVVVRVTFAAIRTRVGLGLELLVEIPFTPKKSQHHRKFAVLKLSMGCGGSKSKFTLK